MKMETATQRMRYNLLLKLYGEAYGKGKIKGYSNHTLEPIVTDYCWTMPIGDVAEACQHNGCKNMSDLVFYHMNELHRFWPTTMNTYSVGIALELSTDIADENFSKEQLDYALRMSEIDLSSMVQAFGSDQLWSIVMDSIMDETRRIMDFVLNGIIQEE